MSPENSLPLSLIISGRNLQRAVLGDLSLNRKFREKRAMDNLLAIERGLFREMGLTGTTPGEIKVNPSLTEFLDGPDGLGGYADVYAQEEYLAPGTKLEMDLERKTIRQNLSSILTPGYLGELKRAQKPLVIIEGGAGPDLRTFETVSGVIAEKKSDLGDIPIKIVITDISRRMAAITASKMRTSTLIDPELNLKTAVLAADVFELLENLPNDLLTYALLPFGVLSFGLDGKNPEKILGTINQKLISGGGMLATVYNSDWLDYSNQLKGIIGRWNLNLPIKDLAPFVIDIKDGQMQVAEGLAFSCRTLRQQELSEMIQAAGLTIVDSLNSPSGWAYWPKDLLAKVVDGRIYPQGCPVIPPSNLMDLVKQQVINQIISGKGGGKNPASELYNLIPDGQDMAKYPAPYITITAKK